MSKSRLSYKLKPKIIDERIQIKNNEKMEIINAYIVNFDMYDMNVNFSVDIDDIKQKAKRRNAICYTKEEESLILENLKNEK